MNITIPCPLCQHPLNVKDPKPGKYKPKCSSCKQAFALIVDDGSPPKIRVGKLISDKPVATSETQVTSLPEPSAVAMTSVAPPSTISRPAISGLDQTVEQVAAPESVRDETKPRESGPKTERPNATRPTDPALETQDSHSARSVSSPNTTSSQPASSDISRLGGYRILRELGAGGMGSVYLARQISLDRPCALKTIQAKWASNPRVIARFIREAYAAAQLTHHNVVQIYDLGQDSGTNYFSMELVSGGSLDDQLKSKGKLPPKLAATLILQASRGLKFAHDHGMVHRDIKPANLMMTSDGLVKVADMGLIKTPSSDDQPQTDTNESDVQSLMLASARSHVTVEGSSMGTPAYMSPEQSLDAASVDKRADIYSLGCTFYALLVGKPPFDGNTMLEVITKHRTEPIVRPERVIQGLPSDLGDIIEKMTMKSPDDRYQDLEDVIHDLEVYLELRSDTSHVATNSDRTSESSVDKRPATPISEQTVAPMYDGNRSQIHVAPELASQILTATKSFDRSPLLLVRKFAPIAWVGLCGFMAVTTLLFAIASGLSLIGESAKNLAGQATAAINQITTPTTDPANPTNKQVSDGETNRPSRVAELFSITTSRIQSFVGYLLALVIAPIASISFAGREGKSPIASRWRQVFIAGGIYEWTFWAFSLLVTSATIYFLGLLIPTVIALVLGISVGAAYYFVIEKSIESNRKPVLIESQSLLKQLRLKGMEEQQIRFAIATNAGPKWDAYFEQLFGYEAMRLMKTRMQPSNKPTKNFFSIRDRIMDRWDARIEDLKRTKDERTLAKAEQADLKAAGISDSEARKRAEAMAATMVEAASETRQSMQEIASGQLTDIAADAKRKRIKQMLAEARSGNLTARSTKSRSLSKLLSKLIGSKFRFACASLLLLSTGMWVQSNQKGLEKYWQQARSTAQSTIDSLKNTTLDSKGLASASQTLSNAAEQTQSTLTQSNSVQWNSVAFGLVDQQNVACVGIAGLLLLWGTFVSGWRISLLLVPLAGLLCILPKYLF